MVGRELVKAWQEIKWDIENGVDLTAYQDIVKGLLKLGYREWENIHAFIDALDTHGELALVAQRLGIGV